MGVDGEAAGIFRRSLTKPGWSGLPACHSLRNANNGGTDGSCHQRNAGTLPRPPPLVLTHGCRGRFTHCHTLAPTCTPRRGGGGGEARLLWLEIGAGIINHSRLPAAESGLSRCAGSAPNKPGRVGPPPAGGRAGHAGRFFAPSGGISITPADSDWEEDADFREGEGFSSRDGRQPEGRRGPSGGGR